MERVLKPFPPDDNMGQQMEEAVDEMTTTDAPVTSQPAVVRRRPWGTRRRTRSTGSLPFTWYQKASDDSSSSVGGDWAANREKIISSLHQSDSDDVSGVQTSGALFNLQSRHLQRQLAGNMESDSVNENFSPIRPNTRRKRKFKRMAVDVEMASTSRPNIVLPCVGPPGSIAGKKKRVLRHNTNCENRFCGNTQILSGASGKRKRSSHHHHHHHHHHHQHHHHHYRSGAGTKTDTTSLAADSPRALGLQRLSIRDEVSPSPLVAMETAAAPAPAPAPPSNSSLSSSESDTGIFTNDEGREGDDEQSDWFGGGESGGGGGAAGGSRSLWEDSDRDEDMEPSFQALLTGNIDLADNHTWQRVRMLNERLGRGHREIRGGRRRVRSEKPGFSVLTSANEKLSKFLQDPAQSELRLHPMQKTERDQLSYLAELYSLNMKLSESSHKGFTCPILTKTSNTMRVEHVSLGRLNTLGDFKRRRKTPPCGSLFNGSEAGGTCDNSASSSIAAVPQATTIMPDLLSSFDNRSS
ncbi:G patch domain-containing protein 2 isoform X4 [Nilaparvata lugens]|uniref:G patch domain-containing protein 2 isoform X3 n=1 Tax=Nilaparvata lugens TaxID=108931 RepID=UPI00193E4851|nr:G patch domain-containing protein 2 isoform X3 [Nilaparvata lugens]XP_039294083.1 G patch domain-containing protein 2 isoform X4 [Nilaparvata lugens]